MPSRTDMGAMFARSDVKLTPSEHPEERAARLRHEARTRIIEDYKNLVVFVIIGVFFVTVVALCLWLVIFERNALPPETRKWCETILASMMSGSVSYFLGKHVGKTSR